MTVDLRDMSFNDIRRRALGKGQETFKWRMREFDSKTGKELFNAVSDEQVLESFEKDRVPVPEEKPKELKSSGSSRKRRGRPRKS